MTANDSYMSLKESLKLQTKMIEQKINQFNQMKQSIEETIQLLDEKRYQLDGYYEKYTYDINGK